MRLGDRSRIRSPGGIGAQVDLSVDSPAPGGVVECAGAAGYGVSTRGSDNALIAPPVFSKRPLTEKNTLSFPLDPTTTAVLPKFP